MVGTPVLFTEYKSGAIASPVVGQATDGVAVALGNPITGASFETGGSEIDQAGPRARRWLGQRTFVVVQGEKIFRTTDGGVNWSTVLTDTELGSTVCKSGLMAVSIANVWHLVILCRSGSGQFTFFYSQDGENWSKAGPYGSLGDQSMALQATTIFQGCLFCVAGLGSFARTYVVPLDSKIVEEFAMSDMSLTQNDAALCVFNGKLYGIWTTTANTMVLHEWRPSGWTTIATLGSAAASLDAARKAALFVDPATGDMIAAFVGNDPLEWLFYRINAALSPTDISSTVRGTPGSTFDGIDTPPSASARVGVIVDGPAGGAVGSAPWVWLYFAPDGDPATAVEVDRWTGVGSVIDDTNTGGNVQSAYPWGVNLGGSPFWSSTLRLLHPVREEPTAGGVRQFFRIYGQPGVTVDAVSARGAHADASTPYPDTTMSLSAPSPGSMNGNVIENLDAGDNGTTLHEVTWGSDADGYVPGDRAQRILEVF